MIPDTLLISLLMIWNFRNARGRFLVSCALGWVITSWQRMTQRGKPAHCSLGYRLLSYALGRSTLTLLEMEETTFQNLWLCGVIQAIPSLDKCLFYSILLVYLGRRIPSRFTNTYTYSVFFYSLQRWPYL